MSRLDSDIYEVYDLINDAKLALTDLTGEEVVGEVKSAVESNLEEIESKVQSIETDADSWEDESEDVDTDEIERQLSNMEDAVSEYISDIRRELP